MTVQELIEQLEGLPQDMEEVKYIPGDLVEFCGRIQGIENIDKQTSYRVSVRLEHGWFVNKPEEILNFLKPIPLTPAILEANGWKKNEYGVYYKNFNPRKVICLSKQDGNNWEVSTGGVTLIQCKFIHQLQHLLFGLGLDSSLKV